MRTYRVFLVAEKGEPVSYDLQAKDHYKAIEMAMDKAFEEQPDNKFMLGGFEEIEL